MVLGQLLHYMVVNGLREDYILRSEKPTNHIVFAAAWIQWVWAKIYD